MFSNIQIWNREKSHVNYRRKCSELIVAFAFVHSWQQGATNCSKHHDGNKFALIATTGSVPSTFAQWGDTWQYHPFIVQMYRVVSMRNALRPLRRMHTQSCIFNESVSHIEKKRAISIIISSHMFTNCVLSIEWWLDIMLNSGYKAISLGGV